MVKVNRIMLSTMIEGIVERSTALNIRKFKTMIGEVHIIAQQIYNNDLGRKITVYSPSVNFTPVQTDLETTAKWYKCSFRLSPLAVDALVKIVRAKMVVM